MILDLPLPLVSPSTSYDMHLFTQSPSSFHNTCPKSSQPVLLHNVRHQLSPLHFFPQLCARHFTPQRSNIYHTSNIYHPHLCPLQSIATLQSAPHSWPMSHFHTQYRTPHTRQIHLSRSTLMILPSSSRSRQLFKLLPHTVYPGGNTPQ